MVFGWFSKRSSKSAPICPSIPTIKFDASRVTLAIRTDLWDRIQEFGDFPVGKKERIFAAAVLSVSRGRDLCSLTRALVELNISRPRAAYIATYLNNRATAFMNVARSRDLGLTEGKWLHSGAPCYSTNTPSSAELAMDAAHRSAANKRFPLEKGMHLNGMWTYPGLELGCKCVMIAVVPGFEG